MCCVSYLNYLSEIWDEQFDKIIKDRQNFGHVLCILLSLSSKMNGMKPIHGPLMTQQEL